MEEEEPESEAIIDQAKPKALLYHYTDQRGLLGILRSQSIWATHIRYLNDSSEYNHGLHIVEREVSQFKVDPSPDLTFEGFPGGADFIGMVLRQAMTQAIEALDKMSIYVASFFDSPEGSPHRPEQDAGDMLGQWRAYSGGSAGFSVGFDKDALSQHIWQAGDETGIPIIGGSCIYQTDLQERYLHDQVAEIIPTALNYFNNAMADFRANKLPQIMEQARRSILHDPPDQLINQTMEKATRELHETFDREADNFSASMTSHLTRIAIPVVFMKNPAFCDEREWRVAKMCNETPSGIMFRPGKSSLIPYIAIPLPRSCDDGTSLIRRIVVGPSPKIDDAVAAVRMFLESQNYKIRGSAGADGVEIVPSRIPYRD